jgi:hypothetical protein
MNATVSPDTIRIGSHAPLPAEHEMRANDWQPLHHRRLGIITGWTKNFSDDEQERRRPNLTWSSNEAGRDWLMAEVSLPKMARGNNVASLSEGESLATLDRLSDFVSREAGRDFDARAALVSRLDFAANFRVGEETTLDYITLGKQTQLTKMHPRHELTTAAFESKGKGKKIQLYSKFHDVLKDHATNHPLVAEARGVLRLETELKKRDVVRRCGEKLGFPDARASEMVLERVGLEILNKALLELGIGDASPISSHVDLLREKFGGGRRLRELLGMKALFDKYGLNFYLRSELHISRASYYKAMRALKDAGVFLDAPNSRALPPLRLVASSETNIIQPYA